MKGQYASRVRLEEKIAAEVELFRLEHYAAASLRALGITAPTPLSLGYPSRVYRPTAAFLKLVEAARHRNSKRHRQG